MTTARKSLIAILVFLLLLIAAAAWLIRGDHADLSLDAVSGRDPELEDPNSEMIPTIAIADPVGWAADAAPNAAKGLKVTRFAERLEHPRVLYTLPNGDVLVALTRAPAGEERGGIEGWVANWLLTKAGATGKSPNKIILLRDSNGDGRADKNFVLRDDLDSPSGMGWHDGTLYIANHNALLGFRYRLGDEKLTGQPKKLMDLPSGGDHWMRNLAINPEGTKLYVAVGSASNIGEFGMDKEQGRAMIWEVDLKSGQRRPFAAGLRNANGLGFSPWTGELWTVVNERDMLGSDLVPDYLTNVPVGAQYGWPWVYWRNIVDRRVTAPMPAYLTEYAREPVYALGPHVAALGMAFSHAGNRMGSRFASGAFIARHGSWNRKPPSGYDVVFVKFDQNGNPVGKPAVVLQSFLDKNGDTRGRPTWVEWAKDGALLVSDDTAGIIWRVIAPDAQPAPPIERLDQGSLRPQTTLSGNPNARFGREDYARVEPAQ